MKHLILLTTIVATALLLTSSRGHAAETDSLLTATDYETSIQALAGTDNFIARGPTGAPCVQHEFRTMIRQLIATHPFFIPAESHDSNCATSTKFGYMEGKYLYQQGETLSGEIVPNINLLALPNSGTVLAGISNGFGAHNIRVWNNYLPFANKVPQQYGRIWYDLPGSAGSDNFVTDKSGQRLPFLYNTVRSSVDGEWMVVYMPGMGMARINTTTLEVLPFGDVRGSTTLAVSSSGRYAAVFYTNDRSLVVFDLAGCAAAPNRISLGVTCPMKNLADELDLPGELENIRYARFSAENVLYLEVEYKNSAGQLVRARIEITPDGADIGAIDYIAMGDSFASGEGELDPDWYELGTDVDENKCHLSRRSYPYLIANQLGLSDSHSVACSGARTWHVLRAGQYDNFVAGGSSLGDWHPGQKTQTEYIEEKTDFLTVSIGGNNVDFSNKLKSCVMSPGTCSFAAEDKVRVVREIAAVHGDILEVYKQLAEKTEGRSKIYALGYPQFIQADGSSCGANVGLLNKEERTFINEAVTYLNQVIRSAAEEAGVYYIDLENSLIGRNLCSGSDKDTMAFNGIKASNSNLGILGNETYHPNHLAHELFKTSILNQTGSNPVDWQVCKNNANICPRGDGLIPLPDISYWGAEAQSYVNLMNDEQSLIAELPPKHQPIIVDDQSYYQPGQEIIIVADGFAPGAQVKIVLRSEPVVLATVTADANGFISTVVDIPKDIEFGFHNLHLLGTNTVNQLVDYYESVPIFVETMDEPEAVEPEVQNDNPETLDEATVERTEDESVVNSTSEAAGEDVLAAETVADETEPLTTSNDGEETPDVSAATNASPQNNSTTENYVSTLPFVAVAIVAAGTVVFIWKKAGSVA